MIDCGYNGFEEGIQGQHYNFHGGKMVLYF